MAKRANRPRHDGFFRSVFANQGVLAAQVRAVLPRPLWRRLDFSRVEVLGSRFSEPTLTSPESDAVFRVTSRPGDACVYVLLEHQRQAPRLMPWRVLRYVTNFWATRLAAEPARGGLPVVIPLVVANVPGGWHSPLSLEALIDAPPDLLELARPFLPSFQIVVDDLSRLDATSASARPGPPLARLAWWLLSLSTHPERLEKELPVMAPVVAEVKETAPTQHHQSMVYLESLPMTTAQRRQVREVFEVISLAEYRRRVPTLMDIIREEAREEAMKQGRRIGLKEGRREGRHLGVKLGREEGVKVGREQGVKVGREQGVKVGREQGVKVGREQGVKVGREQGVKVGREEGVKVGREQGVKVGREQGLEEGLRLALLTLWEARFGRPAGRVIRARLARADASTLKRWSRSLLDAKRPADVFG